MMVYSFRHAKSLPAFEKAFKILTLNPSICAGDFEKKSSFFDSKQ